ncbi:hypothetical protein NA57DRAFT_35192 [Rhizodiscina lignyota]|uniref:Actin-like ATPase domain-containing protein n=1 Tax=Rhizodiscina lignyota TaxID=1504668 RepID=A0A9P4IKU6_9PEZI|nr:hypothetical protein NA57DRAFT_35192 [Rhizodiscina lignyota]
MEKPDLVVGIDFGMTCTGVAYANLTRGDTVKWIARWPHRGQANENKVPTIICYPKGSTQPSSWGFGSENQAEKDDENKDYWEWFKTYLDPNVLQDAQMRDLENAPRSQEEVDKWYEDYLRLLYQHIQLKLGSELPNNKPWEHAMVEFIFSLPTTWQPYPTVEKFRTIVERAGYGQHPTHSIDLGLTEPEAAAVHTSSDAPGIFQESEALLVCDAGGGTTDFSVLRIVGAHKGALTLQQLDVVVGKNIGSVHIDRQFEDHCHSRLHQVNEMYNLGIDPVEAAWSMMKTREFQSTKCDFGSPDTTPMFSIPVPGLNSSFNNPQFGVSRSAMTFTSNELQGMFDSQIQRLFAEIDKQLQSFEQKWPRDTISHLVLSGGLGNSAYVQKRLGDRYALGKSTFACARDIQIHVAPDPQLADPLNNKYYLDEAIAWFIKKGEPINVDVPIVHRFSRKMLPGDITMSSTTSIISTNLDKNLLPLQVNNDAEVLCELESNFAGIDDTKFKRKNRHWWSTGKKYSRMDYEIRTVLGPADLRFELWFDGQKLNRDQPIRVEWQPVSAPDPSSSDSAIYVNPVPTPPPFSFGNKSTDKLSGRFSLSNGIKNVRHSSFPSVQATELP